MIYEVFEWILFVFGYMILIINLEIGKKLSKCDEIIL